MVVTRRPLLGRRDLVGPLGLVFDAQEGDRGLEVFERIESLNDDPAFIRALAALVRERLPREVPA